MNNNDNDNNAIDIAGLFLDAYSVILGLQNLALNTEQVNALDMHLKKQDTEYLAKIIKQNNVQIRQNQQIIELLNKLLDKK